MTGAGTARARIKGVLEWWGNGIHKAAEPQPALILA
jgi:hypothetical protein